jgi:hypothetical protein
LGLARRRRAVWQLEVPLAVLLGGWVGVACDASPGEHPDELARLHRGIDALRDADNHDKAPYLDELRSQECSSPRSCELKRVCTHAYTRHVQALREAAEIGERETPSKDAIERLRAAKRGLVEAEREAQRCVEVQAELRDSSAGR